MYEDERCHKFGCDYLNMNDCDCYSCFPLPFYFFHKMLKQNEKFIKKLFNKLGLRNFLNFIDILMFIQLLDSLTKFKF